MIQKTAQEAVFCFHMAATFLLNKVFEINVSVRASTPTILAWTTQQPITSMR